VREGIKEVWLFERESVASFIVMGVFEGQERRGGSFRIRTTPMAETRLKLFSFDTVCCEDIINV
jgi:hypothetical protein